METGENHQDSTVENPPSSQINSSAASSSSELTKSLRNIRRAKKSPSKTPSKDKSFEGDQEQEDTNMKQSSSPLKEPQKLGTEVFDFTDEEDLPLSNIDLDVLDAASGNDGSLAINIPEPQPTLVHELSQLTPKTSPSKHISRRFEVSPQILTVVDAVAACAALQVGSKESIEAVTEAPDNIKMNGDTLSDDTDTSVNVKSSQMPEKGKVAKRKKRRITESDGGNYNNEYCLLS